MPKGKVIKQKRSLPCRFRIAENNSSAQHGSEVIETNKSLREWRRRSSKTDQKGEYGSDKPQI